MRKLLILSLLFSQCALSQVNLNLGLVGYYPFNGNANDASGNGNNGTVFNGVTPTTDRFGNPNSAYYFDGVDDYIALPNSPLLNFTNRFSVAFYFAYENNTALENIVAKIDKNTGAGTQFHIKIDLTVPQADPGVAFGVNSSASGCTTPNLGIYASSFVQVPAQTWACIVCTFEDGIQKVYFNGVLVKTQNAGFTTVNQCANASIQIGKLFTGDTSPLKGALDDLRFYNRVLNAEEAASFCEQVPCASWLHTPSFATVGDVDVTGNQLTVEAEFTSNNFYIGDQGTLVSKNSQDFDKNYLLTPTTCSVRTENTLAQCFTCPVLLYKTYHVAMVYNGSTLKYYRDGFLMMSVPCTGNLAQNDLKTTIGQWSAGQQSVWQFHGYINEVRIWNVARTQSQIRAYMNTSLPSPATQPGLLAYYVFNDLTNKQGNPAFNAVLAGSADFNQVNPNCSFSVDSCGVTFAPQGIINKYTEVLAFDTCRNSLVVTNSAGFDPGDTVLLIQMKGAGIDSSNTPAFGTITSYNNAGNYEFNFVKANTGSNIELLNKVSRPFDIPNGKVQLVRVPLFRKLHTTIGLTCLPWDGGKGGVLAFNVQDSLILDADIDVSGKGFRSPPALNEQAVNCNVQSYYNDAASNDGAQKGEGIHNDLSSLKNFGRGSPSNGGGGGNAHNSGGGGGGNGGAGGNGGDQWEGCKAITENVGGKGGNALFNNIVQNKLYMGGSGGMGHGNNQNEFPAGGGGGIIIFSANVLTTNSYSIKSNGDSGVICTGGCADGLSGGGAGGTIFIDAATVDGTAKIEAMGGKGADHPGTSVNRFGTGGGGGGGFILLRQPVVNPLFSLITAGGLNGVNINHGNDPWGSAPGGNGVIVPGFQTAIASQLFTPNIDSVRIKDSITGCFSFDFNGLAYTNTRPIASWKWDFGDGVTDNLQNTNHTYAGAGAFTVKLIVTDNTGCSDSITTHVITPTVTADAGRDTSFCSDTPVTFTLNGSGTGGNIFAWSPASLLNDSTLQNPTTTISSNTKFYLAVNNGSGCGDIDSVNIIINPLPLVRTIKDTATCFSSLLVLTTSGAASYSWSPAQFLSDANISNPVFTGGDNQTYFVTGTDNNGCRATDTINITVNPLPVVKTIGDTTICANQTIILVTTGAVNYNWSPAMFLNNATIASPVFTGNTNQAYVVAGTDNNGCTAKDTLAVSVNPVTVFNAPPDKKICVNETVQLQGNNDPRFQYLWSPAVLLDNASSPNPVGHPASTTIFSVEIRDNFCHVDSVFNVRVTVNDLPNVQASKSNDIDCSTDFSQLTATGALQYQWSPASTLNNANIANPVARPVTDTKYTVKGIDINNCVNTDTITIKITGLNKGGYFMPSAFTPNGDGMNDCYGIKYWGAIQKLDFSIYNRWGERIFHTTKPGDCWNGTYRGVLQNPDVYVYLITAETSCGSVTRKGTFALIR